LTVIEARQPNDDDRKTGRGRLLRLLVSPQPGNARFVREQLAGFAREHAIPEADTRDFITAVNEALANAIEHANTTQEIELSCWIVGRQGLIATVVDAGVGLAVPQSVAAGLRTPAPNEVRGRGFAIMRLCTDHLEVHSSPGAGTTVILVRYVRAGRTAPDSHAASPLHLAK
jgi:anti-sigma regulatory factor (Ser/Thr protein kinase)